MKRTMYVRSALQIAKESCDHSQKTSAAAIIIIFLTIRLLLPLFLLLDWLHSSIQGGKITYSQLSNMGNL
jgi:hypothetical protein